MFAQRSLLFDCPRAGYQWLDRRWQSS